MSSGLGSTSWPNRNRPYFARLDSLLAQRPGPVRVAVIGPGAVTRICRPWLTDAGRPPSWLRGLIGDAARYGDQLLRRLPNLPLVCLEAAEIESALTVPHTLTVVDVSQRVLDAVRIALPAAICHQIDLSTDPLPFEADVIIAFNVLSRIEAGARAMGHVLQSLSSDGLLLLDDRSAERLLPKGEFRAIAPKTHQRIQSSAGAKKS